MDITKEERQNMETASMLYAKTQLLPRVADSARDADHILTNPMKHNVPVTTCNKASALPQESPAILW